MMRLTAIPLFLTGIVPLTAVASSRDLATDALKPWEISRLSTFSPSERPGRTLSSVINITISDPNYLPLPDGSPQGISISTDATCGAAWTSDKPPYNQAHSCTEVPYGRWTFEMIETDSGYPSPTTDFVLRFTLARAEESFVGTARFVVGENMRGLCSAGGVCSFGLKEEMVPFLINQTRV
ncbi:hypothetical protein VTK56DRAFT_5782 [Thermocarpiscus australiensis]